MLNEGMNPMRLLFAAFLALSLLPAALASDPQPRPAAGESIVFDVYRDGDTRFGTHEVRFDRDGEDVLVELRIRLRAGLGPITVFRYEHDARERWRDDQLIAMSARTLKDGEVYQVEARREGDDLVVNGDDPDRGEFVERFPIGFPPSSHWHGYPAGMEAMLNTEHGTRMDTTVEYLGEEEIEADGGTIMASRFRLSSTLTVDLWYDENGRWAGCAFEARGRPIRYVRRENPVTG